MVWSNIVSALLGITYTVSPTYNPLWDVFGVILLVTLFGSLFLVYLIDVVVDKTTLLGRRLNLVSYGALLSTLFGMVGILGGNFLLSGGYSNAVTDVWGLYSWIYSSFFGQLAINCYLAAYAMKYSHSSHGKVTSSDATRGHDRHRGFRLYAILSAGLVIGFLAYLALLTLLGAPLSEFLVGEERIVNGFAGVLAGMFGGFWCFMVLAASILIVKLIRRYRLPRGSFALGLVGMVISAIMFVPVVATPLMTYEADAHFIAAFGNWQSRIPANVQQYFLPTRFVVPGYYLGIPAKDCVILKDQLFYTGTSGVDTGIRLYFDAYLPPNGGAELPGANSTLIRIHGGGWTVGDKGLGNMLQMNKYFAAQGYCVFDIQYGLNNNSNFLGFLNFITPTYLRGNFTIEAMIRHIGIFCNYLLANNIYGANLSSVFISGGSAGGHLTCATALAIANGTYMSYFNPGLTIRGLIPYYPGNNESQFIDNGVSPPEFYDPTRLVSAASPPCLVYQGAEDGLVPLFISQELKDAYTMALNPACAIISLPFGGHGSDIYFSGYYNTFFLYYFERFMSLYR